MSNVKWPFGFATDFGKVSAASVRLGPFRRYNSQWDDVVLGLVASYLHAGLAAPSTVTETAPSAAI